MPHVFNLSTNCLQLHLHGNSITSFSPCLHNQMQTRLWSKRVYIHILQGCQKDHHPHCQACQRVSSKLFRYSLAATPVCQTATSSLGNNNLIICIKPYEERIAVAGYPLLVLLFPNIYCEGWKNANFDLQLIKQKG